MSERPDPLGSTPGNHDLPDLSALLGWRTLQRARLLTWLLAMVLVLNAVPAALLPLPNWAQVGLLMIALNGVVLMEHNLRPERQDSATWSWSCHWRGIARWLGLLLPWEVLMVLAAYVETLATLPYILEVGGAF